MTILFKLILLLIMFISFFGSIGEKRDLNLRGSLVAICISSIAAFILASLYL